MSMDLTGIINQNEYYTNHYFSSIFEDNAEDTILAWRNEAKEINTSTPWSKFRDTSKQYYRVRDRYLHLKNEEQSKPMIQEMATLYLQALGYGENRSVIAEVAGNIQVPVLHEETRSNGAPLLWVLLSVANERDDDILQGKIFAKSDNEDNTNASLEKINDDIIAKLFFAGEEAPRWIIIIGINQIALIDRNKWNEKRFLQFDLNDIFSRHEETTFQALSVLLHYESLCPSEGVSVLDTLDENSHKHSAGVSDALKFALRESIELLGNEVIYDMKNRQGIDIEANPIDASELTIQCLRYMYRVLFMLFIEARPELGYAPMKSQVYVQGYSLEGLRDICEKVREESEVVSEGYYLDNTISELFRLVYEGYPGDIDAYKKAIEMGSMHDVFTIEALKAHIFDPEYTSLITKARLRNSAMIQIIDLMSISRPGTTKERRGRISYSALGINQMGAVYEALLSYRGFLAKETLFEVKCAGDKFNELDVGYFVPERELDSYTEEERVRYEKGDKKGQLRKYEKNTFIYRLAGREREKSASYYTPEVLTKCLVKYALKELLKGKTADEILHLTICEPAMGSAAFLNEAINQLAEAYLYKKQEELGDTIAFDKRFEELQKVKMFIADRNVYGVDLNPIAVELAEVSLWLNTIYKGAYVPWFRTQIVCGNSLIGARRQVYYTSKLEKGKWYDEAPDRIMPGDKRKRTGLSGRVYHFLLGDPGMANYTDKVIKGLEPEKIKAIGNWNKKFNEKWDEEDIKTLLRLSDIIDDLWEKTVILRQQVEHATSNHLNVYGYEEADDSMHTTIREKDDIYQRMYKSEHMNNAGPYARLKAAMDYWCALWFWPIDKAELLPTRQEFLFDMDLMLEGGFQTVSKTSSLGQMELFQDESGNVSFVTKGTKMELDLSKTYGDLGIVCLDDLRERNPRLKIANQIANEQKFMHWELEFADLFRDNKGFDLVLGNPPWLKLEWIEQDVLSDRHPQFVVKKLSAKQTGEVRDRALDNTLTRTMYFNEYISISGEQNFLNAVGNYSLLKGQQTNLFKCFLPQSWMIVNQNGVAAFVHPEGVYKDPNGGLLRKEIYKRLKMHFQFSNELKLFKEVDHHTIFSLNIFGKEDKIDFLTMSNLLATTTIDLSLQDEGDKEIPGIKDINSNWELSGHKDRVIHITEDELLLFAQLFDGTNRYLEAKLPAIHAESLLKVLEKIQKYKFRIMDIEENLFCTQMWNETGAQKDGIIQRKVGFNETPLDNIYSGPHFGLGNPMFKSSRIECNLNSDYDNLDLVDLELDYIQRVNYTPACNADEYIRLSPSSKSGESYINKYRIFIRRMMGMSAERSLIPAIVQPEIGHIHTIIGISYDSDVRLLVNAATFMSIIADYYVRSIGRTDLYLSTLRQIPNIKNKKAEALLINRVLRLSCITVHYKKLWENNKKYILPNDSWLKKDARLDAFDISECGLFSKNTAVRTDYQRRQCLIEIDVIVAKVLGITFDELINIYRIHFPVLYAYENDTWYDYHGCIVFTNNRSMTGVGVSRKEWEEIRKTNEDYSISVSDQTGRNGITNKLFTYKAPYDSCNRIKDYEEVWKEFDKRYCI